MSSAKLASGLAVCGAYGVFMGLALANGCSSSSGNRDAGAGTSTVTSTGTTSSSATSSMSSSTTSSASSSTVSSNTVCGCPDPSTINAAGLVYYNGGPPAGQCATGFSFDNVTNDWFGYNDGTDSGVTFSHEPNTPGCQGSESCAYYAMGGGFIGYGAGVGLTLNANEIYPDASGFTGLNVWMMGTTTGTRTQGFMPGPNTVHVKFVTALPDGGDPREGDDYGAYCPLPQDGGAGCFAECNMPFLGLTRDGYKGVDAGAPDPATDMFDPQNLVKIQFEFSSYMLPDSSVANPPVSFNVVIGEVAFY